MLLLFCLLTYFYMVLIIFCQLNANLHFGVCRNRFALSKKKELTFFFIYSFNQNTTYFCFFRWCWLFHHLVFTNVSLCSIRFYQTSNCLLWILKLHKIIVLRRDYQQDLCTTSWILKITEERFRFELHL
jgi:hypothetical protein